MADAIVSRVVERLQNVLIRNVVRDRTGVQWLSNELKSMQCFLKDAEQRQYGDATIQKWVSEIRELAYDIEDVLDTFHLKVQRKPGCFHSVCCVFGMGKEIEKLKPRINELRRSTSFAVEENVVAVEENVVGFEDDAHELRELRRSTSFAVEENVVGFEDDARELLAKLLDKDHPQRCVISIYGMGGSGKTTLARKIFNDVRTEFKCCGWVRMTKGYKIRNLLLSIILSFGFATIKMGFLKDMNDVDLEIYLYKSLEGRSYIVVLDDVREKEEWGRLKGAFPDNNNGSRVIITTRFKEVAEHSDQITHLHELKGLTPDKSWQLFCTKAFQNFDMDKELEDLGRKIVEECGGLPLAIITMAGFLSEKAPREWHMVHDQFLQHLKGTDSKEKIFGVFDVGYNQFSNQSKMCFLYLSCFPKGIEINIEKFIHLLVAEDFIPKVKDRAMEEVAKDYLDELFNKSFIGGGQRYWGRILTCRIHDLLHDFAINKVKNNFLDIYEDGIYSNKSPSVSSCPRQAIYSNSGSSLWLQKCNPCLRSLFLYGEYEFSVPMCKRLSSLRVLFDGSVGNDYVTRKLIHLKYLGLKDSFIFLLPSIVFNLPRLQTLYVPRSVFPVDLPAEICKSQELRHLIGNFSCVPSSIESLTNLQTLRSITNRAWTEIKTGNLGNNLRELWLAGPLKGLQVFSFDSMANLKSLQILSVELRHDDSFGSLQPLSDCQHLVELRLQGKMEKLPEDIDKVLPNLRCLSLRDSRLKDDPIPILEKLLNLKILHLGYRFCSRKKIMCSANGFPRLEILLFDEHKFQIEEWQVEEKALPSLTGLRIPENLKVKIPERLRTLPTPDPREYTTKPPDDVDQYEV